MVLKQVHPDLGISSMAMSMINSLMNDMFERIAEEAAKLSEYRKRTTLSSGEIQGAVKLVLPGELGKHAIAEGSEAGTNYISHGEPCHKLILVRESGFDHLLYNFFLPITNGYSQFVTCIIGFVVIFPFCAYQEHPLLSRTHGYFLFPSRLSCNPSDHHLGSKSFPIKLIKIRL